MSQDRAAITATAAIAGLLVGLGGGCGTRAIAGLADADVVHATEPAHPVSAEGAAEPSASARPGMSCTPAMMGSAGARAGEKMACSAEMMHPKK